jgi:hypothetical protein
MHNLIWRLQRQGSEKLYMCLVRERALAVARARATGTNFYNPFGQVFKKRCSTSCHSLTGPVLVFQVPKNVASFSFF